VPAETTPTQDRANAAISINMSGNARLSLNGPLNYADHGSTNTVTTTDLAAIDATGAARAPFWRNGIFWAAVAALAAAATAVAAFM
jgi:hypothetical protein